jgi:hypothetical protein
MRRVVLVTLFLLALLAAGALLWIRSERHQYVLNRQLIAALMQNDSRTALALVNEGADPNTRYMPTPAPSLLERVVLKP